MSPLAPIGTDRLVPGALYYLSAWYTKQELGKRYAALFIGQQLGNGFGGLIAAGVLTLDGVHGVAGWRWLFIVYVRPPLARS